MENYFLSLELEKKQDTKGIISAQYKVVRYIQGKDGIFKKNGEETNNTTEKSS